MSRVKLFSLGELAEKIDYGVTASASTEKVGPKFLRITDIQSGSVDWRKVPYCEASPKEVEQCRLQRGDIVFARTGATTGKSFLIESAPDDAVFASYLIRIRPSSEVDPSYLAHFFKTRSYWRQITTSSRGAAQPGVNSTVLKTLEVPLLKFSEQKRIAAILDKADALRAKRRKALEQLDALAQAIFIEMFSTPTAQGWKEVPIELLASQEPGAIRTGPFGSQLLHSEFTDEGVAVLGIDNAVQNEFAWGESRYVSMEKYKQLSRYTVKPGDVIITIMGTCGRCAVVPQNIPLAINTKHLCCITLDQAKCLPDFLHAYFLRHPLARGYLERTAKGAIMSGLNMGIIKSMPVKLPPLELQAEFVRRIEGVRKQKAILQGHAKQLDALFSSLQHRAFCGEL